ncbi:uncharacterized protein LOC135397835 [Ornithodoros turicata]|uniref:uncharacterized protein LOC135397835 n=1 Tax=Ornithodoros turicata TaxID=34597 RepID=UPI0031391F44
MSQVKSILQKFATSKIKRRLSFAANVKNPDDEPIPPPEAFIAKRPSLSNLGQSTGGGQGNAAVGPAPAAAPARPGGRMQVEVVRDQDGILSDALGGDAAAAIPLLLCVGLCLCLVAGGFIIVLQALSGTTSSESLETTVSGTNLTSAKMTKPNPGGRRGDEGPILTEPSADTVVSTVQSHSNEYQDGTTGDSSR